MVAARIACGKIRCTYENRVGIKKTGNHFENLVVHTDRVSNTPSKNRVSKYGIDSLGIRNIHEARPCRHGAQQNEGLH
jgi:hypothetical protein